jgi:hypothetical protein
MTVAELIEMLRRTDPQAKVLYLGEYADVDESDEIREVVISQSEWTHERGRYEGREYAVRYPGRYCEREAGYTDVTHEREKVVVLSTGQTNLHYHPES